MKMWRIIRIRINKLGGLPVATTIYKSIHSIGGNNTVRDPSFRSSRCYIVLVVSLAIMSPASCHFCTVGHLSACDGQFLPRSTVSLDPNFPDQFPFFRHATFVRRNTFLQAAANSLLDPRFSRDPSLIFWRRSAARLQTLRRPDRHYCGVFLGCLLMLLYGLQHLRIRLSLCR
jgi:hypothetical protein